MLANSTAINDFWMSLNKKYDLMNHKKAFWHHYIQEGMPAEDFVEFREDLAALGDKQKVQIALYKCGPVMTLPCGTVELDLTATI